MKRETYEYYTAKILKQLMMGYGETMQDNPAVGFTKRVKAGVYDCRMRIMRIRCPSMRMPLRFGTSGRRQHRSS